MATCKGHLFWHPPELLSPLERLACSSAALVFILTSLFSSIFCRFFYLNCYYLIHILASISRVALFFIFSSPLGYSMDQHSNGSDICKGQAKLQNCLVCNTAIQLHIKGERCPLCIEAKNNHQASNNQSAGVTLLSRSLLQWNETFCLPTWTMQELGKRWQFQKWNCRQQRAVY